MIQCSAPFARNLKYQLSRQKIVLNPSLTSKVLNLYYFDLSYSERTDTLVVLCLADTPKIIEIFASTVVELGIMVHGILANCMHSKVSQNHPV